MDNESLKQRIAALQKFTSVLADIFAETATPAQLEALNNLYKGFDKRCKEIGWE